MKTVLKNVVICSMILASMLGCSDYEDFKKSSVVPAADADLKVTHDGNNNYRIEINVEDLAEPHALTPAKSNYVAWVVSEYGTYNIGELEVDKKLRGSLHATTPYQPIRVKITAEDNPNATAPGNLVVLTSKQVDVK